MYIPNSILKICFIFKIFLFKIIDYTSEVNKLICCPCVPTSILKICFYIYNIVKKFLS